MVANSTGSSDRPARPFLIARALSPTHACERLPHICGIVAATRQGKRLSGALVKPKLNTWTQGNNAFQKNTN